MLASAKLRTLCVAAATLACLCLLLWPGVRPAEANHCVSQITGVQTSSFTGNSITISWTIPPDTSCHGWVLSSYKVEHKRSSDSTWVETIVWTNAATVSSLAYNTSYDFRVSGRWYNDEAGAYTTGASSSTHSQTTATGPPSGISGLTSTAHTDDSISLSWNAAPSNGAAITGYYLQYKMDGDTTWLSWTIGNVRTATVTGLTINQRYNFRVRASNSNGYGPWTAVSTFRTNSAPLQISGISSSAQTGFTITLGWTAPTSDGAITDYDVQYRRDGQDEWTLWPDAIATTSVQVTGLFGNQEYEFQARATNSIGTGEWSATFSQATKAVPDQVAGLILTSVNKTRLSILWRQPPSTETITEYHIDYRENTGAASATWTRLTTSISVNSLTIGSVNALTQGTSYEVRVRAKSSEGEGAWSETLFVETNPDLFAERPPDNFRLEQLDSSPPTIVVKLTWKEVDEATAYQVQREVDGTVTLYSTTDLHYENTYDNDEDANGQLAYRVRAQRTASDGTVTYSPWTAEETLLYFGSGQMAAPDVLQQEIEGRRIIDPDVEQLRANVESAITTLSDPTGLQVDTGGIMNFLALTPGLVMFGAATFAGWKYRQVALGFGLGYVLLTISLFIGAALLGFPIIWPILLVVFATIVGVVGMGKAFGWL